MNFFYVQARIVTDLQLKRSTLTTKMADYTMEQRIEELERRKQEALHAGTERSIERQHEKGKLLARERIDYLLDPGSFNGR